MFTKILQRTNTCRQAAKEFCEDKGIPLKDAMAMLNTNYANKARTCGTDTDTDGIADRHLKARLDQTAKKVVGLKWRSPDMSEGQIL